MKNIIVMYRNLKGDNMPYNNEYHKNNDIYDESDRKLYYYKKDSSRKIIEEPTTIYEVDNECILRNRKISKKI